MIIVRPYARIVNDNSDFVSGNIFNFERSDGKRLLKKIEYMARISHRSEESMTETSHDKLLNFLVHTKGDLSVIEHVSLTVLMYHDRGVQQELTRHRLASYTIESTRFVNYEKKMPPLFIYPKTEVECEYCLAGSEPKAINGLYAQWAHLLDGQRREVCKYDYDWLHAIGTSENQYKRLIAKGWAPQEARSVFVLGLGSLIADTANLRQWRHEMLLRTTKETHPQFRQITIPLLAELKEKIPIIFDDIEPLASQAENMKKMR